MQSIEDIYAALFALIADNPAFVTTSRTFRSWGDVSPGDQPAIFQRQLPFRVGEPQAYGAPAYNFAASWWIYAQYSPDSGTIPVTLLNGLVDVALNVLLNNGEPRRLGGLAAHCFVEGQAFINEGVLPGDTQSIAVLPISIVTGL